MKRREVLKGLSTVAGGALLPGSAWSVFAQQPNQSTNPPLAVPIRALARKNGVLMQPIQISVTDSGPGTSVVTSLNGKEVDRRTLTEGVNKFLIFVQPVEQAKDVTVSVTVGDQPATVVVTLQPVRKFVGYFLPHSHHDLGYTDLQPKIEDRQVHNIESEWSLRARPPVIPRARASCGTSRFCGAPIYTCAENLRRKEMRSSMR